MWAALSVYAFSIDSLHALNDTRQIPVDFPGTENRWRATGESDVFTLCGNALCAKSDSGDRARYIYDIPVDPDTWHEVDWLSYEVIFAQNTDAMPEKADTSSSFIVARARSVEGKNLRNIGSIIGLEYHSDKRVHHRISSLHPQTANLQLVLVVRGTISSTITDVHFYTVSLSAHYLILRAIIFSGWGILLLLISLRVLSQLSRAAQVLSAASFSLLLVVGTSQYGSSLVKWFSAQLEASWFAHWVSTLTISINTSLALLHVVFHLMLTLSMGSVARPIKLTYSQIIALNLSIAIGIECVQMAIPERSADIGDIVAAGLGTLVGLILLWTFRLIRDEGKTHSRD